MKLFARLGKSIDASGREATSRPFSCFVIKKQKSAKDKDRRVGELKLASESD